MVPSANLMSGPAGDSQREHIRANFGVFALGRRPTGRRGGGETTAAARATHTPWLLFAARPTQPIQGVSLNQVRHNVRCD